MSTRCVVASVKDNKGVYVRYDGEPSYIVPILQKVIARDGVDRATEKILKGKNGWSFLSIDYSDPGQRYVNVTGYGAMYRADGSDGDMRYWTPQDSDKWKLLEYIYVIREDGGISFAKYAVPSSSMHWNHSGSNLPASVSPFEKRKAPMPTTARPKAEKPEVTPQRGIPLQMRTVSLKSVSLKRRYNGFPVYQLTPVNGLPVNTAAGSRAGQAAAKLAARSPFRQPVTATIYINGYGTVTDIKLSR